MHSVKVATDAGIILDKIVMEVENREALRETASVAMKAEQPHAGLCRLVDVLTGKIQTEVLRPGLSALAYCSYDHQSCELISEIDGVASVAKLLASGGGGKVTYGL